MIVVRIELHSAVTHKITEIGSMVISNDGTSEASNRGNYTARLARRGAEFLSALSKPAKVSKVKDYPRLSYPVWSLVKRALNNMDLP